MLFETNMGLFSRNETPITFVELGARKPGTIFDFSKITWFLTYKTPRVQMNVERTRLVGRAWVKNSQHEGNCGPHPSQDPATIVNRVRNTIACMLPKRMPVYWSEREFANDISNNHGSVDSRADGLSNTGYLKKALASHHRPTIYFNRREEAMPRTRRRQNWTAAHNQTGRSTIESSLRYLKTCMCIVHFEFNMFAVKDMSFNLNYVVAMLATAVIGAARLFAAAMLLVASIENFFMEQLLF